MNTEVIAEFILKYKDKFAFLEKNGKQEVIKIENVKDIEKLIEEGKVIVFDLHKKKIQVL